MAQHAAPTTLETTVNNLTNECEDGQDNQQPTAYTPVFSKGVRTAQKAVESRNFEIRSSLIFTTQPS